MTILVMGLFAIPITQDQQRGQVDQVQAPSPAGSTVLSESRVPWETTGDKQQDYFTDANGIVHAVFANGSNVDGYKVWYANSTAWNWTAPVFLFQLPEFGPNNVEPQIVVTTTGTIYIALFIRNFDSGLDSPKVALTHDQAGWNQWAAWQNFTQDQIYEESLELLVGADNVVHLLYSASWMGGSNNIYYTNGTGSTFHTPVNLTNEAVGYTKYGVFLDHDNYIHFTTINTSTSSVILYSKSPLGGWSAPIASYVYIETQCTIDVYNPQVVADSSGNPHVVWINGSGGSDLHPVGYANWTGTGFGNFQELFPEEAWIPVPDGGTSGPLVVIDSNDVISVAIRRFDYNAYDFNGAGNVQFVANVGGTWETPLNVTGALTREAILEGIALNGTNNQVLVFFQQATGEDFMSTIDTGSATGIATNSPPTINSPADVKYTIGIDGNSITWIAADTDPQYYKIEVDGVSKLVAAWTGGSVNYNVDGLQPGVHKVKCTVNDTLGQMAYDEVLVTVNGTVTKTIPAGTSEVTFAGVAGTTVRLGITTTAEIQVSVEVSLANPAPVNLEKGMAFLSINASDVSKITFPVTLAMEYTDELLAASGIAEENLTFWWYNPTKAQWEELKGTVNPAINRVTVTLDHFSVFSLASKGASSGSELGIDIPGAPLGITLVAMVGITAVLITRKRRPTRT